MFQCTSFAKLTFYYHVPFVQDVPLALGLNVRELEQIYTYVNSNSDGKYESGSGVSVVVMVDALKLDASDLRVDGEGEVRTNKIAIRYTNTASA